MRNSIRDLILPAVVAASLSWSANEARAVLEQWTLRYRLPASTNDTSLTCVAFGQDNFLAFGLQGGILTSRDGVSWTGGTSGTTNRIWGAVCANSIFVAVGDLGTILTSPNGADWTIQSSGTTNALYGVTYASGIFVAVGSRGAIVTSPDGTNWTTRTSGSSTWLNGIAFGNGAFVVPTSTYTVLTSPDGISWSSHIAWTDFFAYAIAYGNGTFVGVGDGRYGVSTSTDGVVWIEPPYTNGYVAPVLYSIAFGSCTFVAVGIGTPTGGPASLIAASSDGTNWTTVSFGIVPGQLSGVTSGGGSFVVVGTSATILESQGAILPPLPKLGPVAPLSGGMAQGTIKGVPGRDYEILASTNLADWSPLANVTVSGLTGTGHFNDPGASTNTQRFYRAMGP